MIEGETFKLHILLTHTGITSDCPLPPFCAHTDFYTSGTKFILLTSIFEPTTDAMLQKVYEIYAESVMKNPFHTPDMPIRTEAFDTKVIALLGGR